MKITFITSNQHKVKEAKGIFDNFGIELEHTRPRLPRDPRRHWSDVAKYGAKYVAKRFGKPVIVEDAGIFIKALKWFPGTYSSYVQDTLGNKGILKLMSDMKTDTPNSGRLLGSAPPKPSPRFFLALSAEV